MHHRQQRQRQPPAAEVALLGLLGAQVRLAVGDRVAHPGGAAANALGDPPPELGVLAVELAVEAPALGQFQAPELSLGLGDHHVDGAVPLRDPTLGRVDDSAQLHAPVAVADTDGLQQRQRRTILAGPGLGRAPGPDRVEHLLADRSRLTPGTLDRHRPERHHLRERHLDAAATAQIERQAAQEVTHVAHRAGHGQPRRVEFAIAHHGRGRQPCDEARRQLAVGRRRARRADLRVRRAGRARTAALVGEGTLRGNVPDWPCRGFLPVQRTQEAGGGDDR